MNADPILRQVHRMKDQFAREMEYDLSKMCERLREDAKQHPERMVNLEDVDKMTGRKPVRRNSAKS